MGSRNWDDPTIIRYLVREVFARSLVLVDHTHWTGHECDLLVVHPSLRLIDVEVKVDKQDFKIDALKDKWWMSVPNKHRPQTPSPWLRGHLWPDKIWKHYYVVPMEVWSDTLLPYCPPNSGIVLVKHQRGYIRHNVIRAAKPDRNAKPVTTPQAIDIARLASLRLWNTRAWTEKGCKPLVGDDSD